MPGWIVPPPREPLKGRGELQREREEKVRWLVRHGFLRSERIKVAMLKVRREDFIPLLYRDYAYQEVPLPLPGESATISCPHSYPLFYEALGLDEGHRLLEVGLGSGYGAALAREIVGDSGLVVSLEIDPLTFDFARQNLAAVGYRDIVLVNADGGLGWPELAPYDRICVTAACPQVPPPLVEQLVPGGLLAAPVISAEGQDLVLVEKRETETSSRVVCQVLYVSLRGKFGEE
ncbi:protein-L-isoaspartate O-methyltransferase [Geobacter sp.]|uniref:protein-L-isoaspartate O-methyltransferase n=1 Tax=Geobacter sp. TaxID=46610 RepID=UPI002637149E|nr:protein-L-isoaspartate O-methyltransferase [Geobacter sp.]